MLVEMFDEVQVSPAACLVESCEASERRTTQTRLRVLRNSPIMRALIRAIYRHLLSLHRYRQ